MVAKLDWFPTRGLVGGEIVQFADGRRSGQIGDGIGLNDAAFDVIESYLAASCSEWTPAHRYGVLELSHSARTRMVEGLRRSTDGSADQIKVRASLADWLSQRSGPKDVVSILGY